MNTTPVTPALVNQNTNPHNHKHLCLAYSSALKIETAYSLELSLNFYRTARHHTPNILLFKVVGKAKFVPVLNYLNTAMKTYGKAED
jgi:hypothetical protein